MEKTTIDQRPEWLKSMAEKTWNLEMIISGAATYLTSFLPELTNKGFYFFLDNMNIEQDGRKLSMVLLAYSFAKIIAWLLPITFIIHFMMRAFWAGLVGLHTVYPAGIQYDKLPNTKQVAKELYEKKFGALSDYIQRLDSWCNLTFAIAFTIVLFGFGLSFIYLIIFGCTEIATVFVGAKHSHWLSLTMSLVFTAVAFSMLIINFVIQKIDKHQYPRLFKVASSALVIVPSIILPFIYRPINFMSMTFSSNIPKRRFYAIMISVMTILMGVVFVFILHDIKMMLKKAHPFAFQNYFGAYQNQYALNAANYDDTRPEGIRISPVSIPSEIVEGPFLKVFVTYPKSMDQTLAQVCTIPDPPDSLPVVRRRVIIDSLRADCFQKTLRLSVNDSVYSKVDWLFHRHPYNDQVGVVTFLNTQNFKLGKNQIVVQLPSAVKTDSLVTVGQVPFWFGGK